jgi:ligand-binding SRPBCC domain-containing protein
MAEFVLTRETVVERPLDEVFAFFSDAANLERITPPALNFHIITPQPITIQKGTLIDYELKMHGIPMNWRTEITEWDPPFEFIDTQLKGPYSQWIHRHTFTDLGDGRTNVEDEVRYRLPLEPLGDLFHFIVRGELEKVFDFRQQVIAEVFGNRAVYNGHSPE